MLDPIVNFFTRIFQLIGRGQLFARASEEARAQANHLVEALRLVRDEHLQTPPLHINPGLM